VTGESGITKNYKVCNQLPFNNLRNDDNDGDDDDDNNNE
jgi:hypothetical protein